jgi:uncharacterized coiled-coil protein SlyX
MDKALQDIQVKLDQLYVRLEAVNAEIDKHPTADLMKRMEVLESEIDLVIDQMLDAENQAASNKAQG